MAVELERHGQVQIARILGRTITTLRSSLVPLVLAAMVLVAAPQFAMQHYLSETGPNQLGDLKWPARGALMLLSTATAALLQGLVIRVCLDRLLEREVPFGEAIASALPRTVSLIALGILTAMLVGAGAILLVIPGIILYIGLSVASAAMVQEELSTIPAVKRSWGLTRGSRWRIFWLFAFAGSFYLLALGGASFAARSMISGGVPQIAAVAIYAAILALVEILAGSLKAALYLELRTAKEGHPSEALAAVFE